MLSFFDVPLFPEGATVSLWLIVLGCSVSWVAAYAVMIAKGFRDRIFCEPVAALCGNLLWDFVFGFIHPNPYLLVRLGNCLWFGFDVLIAITIIRYGRRDFVGIPFLQRWLVALMMGGTALGAYVLLRFIVVYNDILGYSTGWIQAFFMSFLFVAMLLRRGNVSGQSMLIAIAMVFGNFFAWLWAANFPAVPRLDPAMNHTYAVATVGMNTFYAILLFLKYRELGISPWTKDALWGGGTDRGAG